MGKTQLAQYGGHAPETQHWLEAGEYLPTFMRDFHDQKDLFKALQEVVERSNEKRAGPSSLSAGWIEYHVYTVDIFLWVMARHGYTLQPSRKRVPFSDIHHFISEARKRAKEASAAIFREAFSKKDTPK